MIRLSISFIIALLAMAFTTSCSKDDEPEAETTLAVEQIAGEYLGEQNTTVTVMGAQVPVKAADVKASVVAQADGKMTVTIKDFTYNNDNYGDIVVESATLGTATASEAAFAGNGNCTLTKNGKEFTAEVVSLVGKYVAEGSKLALDIDMNLPVSPKMTIEFKINYNGQK